MRAFERVWVPLLISALVTVIGFGSLMVNRIPAIFELGAFAVVGVLCLTATTLLGLPAALALLPVERVAQRAQSGTPSSTGCSGRLARAAARVPRPDPAPRRSFWPSYRSGACDRYRSTRTSSPSSSPRAAVRTDNETINQQIVGTNPFYIVVEGGPGALKRWEVLKLVKDLQTYIETLPGHHVDGLGRRLPRAARERHRAQQGLRKDIIVTKSGKIRAARAAEVVLG